MAQTTADAIVIGAGINGAATAFNLLKRGLRRVVLIDKLLLAAGGTGRSAAIIRQHYSNEELVQMVKRSTDLFHHFADEIGGNSGFVCTGWAFLVPAQMSEGLDRNMALGRSAGVDVREIDSQQLQDFEPRVSVNDVARIAYEPRSGYADPIKTTHAYVSRFIQLGGDFRPLTHVTGLLHTNSRVCGVRTSGGDISACVVINAAGPWASRVASYAGIDLPINVTREEEIILETESMGGPPALCFSDMALAIYYRPHGHTQMLVGRGYPKEYESVDPDSFREQVDAKFVEEVTDRLRRRWQTIGSALPVNSYTGLYDVTPDWHPVLGKVDGVDGFYICAGFSGHGFKIGPAVGELMAEEIVDGKAHTVPLDRFNLRRFANGNLFTAAYGGNRA
jgi:glycine/D-amino acid oxidase-like deaminating enzyme